MYIYIYCFIDKYYEIIYCFIFIIKIAHTAGKYKQRSSKKKEKSDHFLILTLQRLFLIAKKKNKVFQQSFSGSNILYNNGVVNSFF